ncbi:class I SAM-dependent methyltransferase [Treponema vincentii]|jgi:SAM-dependent methyltransferase|uniref:class I SAM-dependent methyltransferase n=1 Tax=Treponema vincentii TaxID=69710 RepID=UPI0020A3674A|nr:class I SAM-dependent methyltransferase [Treponema vincentii]UTC60154.1 class I SAM-dependent methyltransferase [Treponema vincentii]
MHSYYYEDNLTALQAKFAAQKLAFAPAAFQTAKAMVDLHILEAIEDSKTKGLTIEAIIDKTGLSSYTVKLLVEFSLSLELVKIVPNSNPNAYVLGKTGYFLLNDELTKANMNFMNDVCYQGLFYLQDSLKTGKPAGLKVFGDWDTIYQGLSSLPEQVQKSWFAFDHYYSDSIFDAALPIVFKEKPRHIMDIGSNTGKFTKAALSYNNQVLVTMVDLPQQIAMAQKNPDLFGFKDRIETFPTNILNAGEELPSNVDTVWMSQFLDCFSLDEVQGILRKIKKYVPSHCNIFVLEPLWDMQRFEAASYSIQATSIYFAAMANGNSKMYSYSDLVSAIEAAGCSLVCAHHNLGINSYSLLQFRVS